MTTEQLQQVKCEPQPKVLASGWLYEKEFYRDDEFMQDHLFHNVYGGNLANGIGDNFDEEWYPQLIDGAWYWVRIN